MRFVHVSADRQVRGNGARWEEKYMRQSVAAKISLFHKNPTMFYHNLFIVISILYGRAHHKALLFTEEKRIVSARGLKAPEGVFGNCILTNFWACSHQRKQVFLLFLFWLTTFCWLTKIFKTISQNAECDSNCGSVRSTVNVCAASKSHVHFCCTNI